MDADPLSVFLVKRDSKGDRLLFKYPYKKKTLNSKDPGASANEQPTSRRRKANPYSLIVPEEEPRSLDSECRFSDEVLSSLFAVKQELCDAKFELKVNNVRFVGHPTLVPCEPLMLVNVVFSLQALASHSIVKCYYGLSKSLGIALRHEERRCGYLSEQVQIMTAAHEDRSEDANNDNYNPFELIAEQCSLAKDLEKVYNDLINYGQIHLRINGWVYVGFDLPQKVHHLHNRGVKVSSEALKQHMEKLRPYHGILLLVDPSFLIDTLFPDCSPTLIRLVKIYTPLKSFQVLAADADLTLRTVCNLACHLVYLGKAIIIYPICESNVYIAAPNNVLLASSPLVEKFAETFPGRSLIQTVAAFPFPTSIRQTISPINGNSYTETQIIIWLLQHRLLVQLHTYIYYMPTNKGLHQLDLPGSGVTKSEGSICEISTPSETLSLSGLDSDGGDSTGDEAGASGWETEDFLARVSSEERTTLINTPASPHQLKLLVRLIQQNYLTGEHHIEDIMYMENLRRSQILQLLDKFRDVLFTCETEDPTLEIFNPSG
ncbi:Nitrogen Permease Hypothetical protein amino acid transport activity 3 [Nesidiocoris tenuis]|uniref:GATOR complex protein NPRL3 n=1 Tax=Nesidiocoris tenuis TaxID=355587 RepID=A0ABN7ATZ3_9HEMI|nr:Nitrogen Permease Hypothetical protein amino acid transport activity 3 [Nesidiocoris tenuis]